MSVEDRISQLIWKSEAETVPTKPNPKIRVEPEPPKEPNPPKPEPTRPRPETVYLEPQTEPPGSIGEGAGKPPSDVKGPRLR